MTPQCEHCVEPLPLLARKDTRFCSGRCRVAAHRARRRLPRGLTSRAHWVRHSAAKVPLTVEGRAASSTDPGTWCSFREVSRSSVGAGAGFVLAGDGVVCLDLDHCLEDGVLAGWARRVLELVPPTYVEVSPSGTGLHVWGRGVVGRGRRVRVEDGGSVEVYDRGRFITVTRLRFEDAPVVLADLSAAVAVFT